MAHLAQGMLSEVDARCVAFADCDGPCHACGCGTEAQRDILSSHLEKYCSNHTLDTRLAQAAWPAA